MARRLFPVVHPDDPEQEAEYQRLMRDELVSSRLAAIDVVEAVLGGPAGKVHARRGRDAGLRAGRQRVRLVLGTLLDVSEDEDESRPRAGQLPGVPALRLPVVAPRLRHPGHVARPLIWVATVSSGLLGGDRLEFEPATTQFGGRDHRDARIGPV